MSAFEVAIAEIVGATQPPKINHLRRVITALERRGTEAAVALAAKLRACRRGARCSSLYCSSCRHRPAAGLRDRCLQHMRGENDGCPIDRRRFLYVTALAELVPLADPKRIRASIAAHRRDYKALKRRFRGLWCEGAVEIEVVDYAMLVEAGCSVKARTIAQMLKHDTATKLSLYPKLVLVHSHALIDVNSHSIDDVRDWTAARFPLSRQVCCKGLRPRQPLEELCWKIGSYPFKDRVAYNLRFETEGYQSGAYFDDNTLANLALAYDGVCSDGFKQLLIGTNKGGAMNTNARGGPKNPR